MSVTAKPEIIGVTKESFMLKESSGILKVQKIIPILFDNLKINK